MSFPPPPSAYPQPGYGAAPSPPPPNNMALAVTSLIVGVLCGGCLAAIPGIIAVVSAGKVSTLWNQGDQAGAVAAAGRAKTMALVAFGLTVVIFIAVVALNLVAVSADTSSDF